MGVSDIREIASLEDRPISSFSGETVAIDAYQYLYCYSTVVVRYRDQRVYTSHEGENLSNILGLLKGIPMLLRHDIDPIFVFDGGANALKQDTIDQRESRREDAELKMQEAAQRGDVGDFRRFKAQTQRITPTTTKTSKRLLDHLGVPYVEAPNAGEAHAATLVENGVADAVLSDDYDSILFGAPETLRQYSGKGDAERMSLNETLEKHGISHEKLVDIALLIGTDYNTGISGIGPKRGLKYIKKHGRIEQVLEDRDEYVENVDTLRSIFLDSGEDESPSYSKIRQKDINPESAIQFATDKGIPEDEIRQKIRRFPGY